MRKIIYLIPFFLLLLPIVTSHTFDFTDTYDITGFSVNKLRGRITAYNGNDTYWWLSYQQGSPADKNMRLNRLNTVDYSSLNITTGVLDCGTTCVEYDCNIRDRIYGKVMNCIVKGAIGTNYAGGIFEWNLSTGTESTLEEFGGVSSNNASFFGVCQDQPLILWEKTGETDLRYTGWNGLYSIGTTLFNGQGVWNLPASYEDLDDVQIVFCGGAYHVVGLKSGSIFDFIYTPGKIYQRTQSFSISDWNVEQYNYGVWENDNKIYVVQVNNTNDTFESVRSKIDFSSWSCDDDFQISKIFARTYNQTVINSTANYSIGNYITKPFLTKDVNGLFNLFYEWNDGAESMIKTSVDFSDCICGDWIAQTECDGGYQKYERNCNPYGCESNTTTWAETSYCGVIENKTLDIREQETTFEIITDICNSEWIDVGTDVAVCVHDSIQIPDGCTSPNVTITATPHFQGKECSTGEYDLTACTPTYDCNITTQPCTKFNYTVSKTDISTYSAGEFATGRSVMFVPESCSCPWYDIFGGIDKFKLSSVLMVKCIIPCTEEWVCIDSLNRALNRIDCDITNITSCQFGCSDGVCLGSQEGDISPVSIGWWTKFFINPETTTNKFVVAMVGCTLIGGVGIYISNGSRFSGLLFIFMFFIGWAVFTIMNFIPAILTIVMVFGIGAYFLLTKLKGA